MERIKSKRCPNCKNEIYVADTRTKDNVTRRRYACYECGYRFTTYEVNAEEYMNYKEFLKSRLEIMNQLKEAIEKIDSPKASDECG